MRFMGVPENKLPPNPLEIANLESRGLANIPAIIAITEKEALFSLSSNDGKIAYIAFYGSDSVFLG
jgi:hypothetical protein